MAVSLFTYTRPILYRGLAAPNILQRVRIPPSLLKDATLFHRYVIVDGDRPETIADHYYGSPFFDWVVCLSNNMVSVYEEWPLTQDNLNRVIKKKYGSVEQALETISHYKIDTTIPSINAAAFDALPARMKQYWSKVSQTSPQVYSITPNPITITPSSYAALAEEEKAYWVSVSIYDKLFEENEQKRSIKLIDARAVPELERSLKQLINDQL